MLVEKARRRAVALLAILAILAASCGGGSDTAEGDTEAGGDDTSTTSAEESSGDEGSDEEATSGGDPVTIEWWHIQNADPGMSNWQAMADAYMADHPEVNIEITVMENEAFKAALQTNMQAGDVPDLFQSWGGGGLREQVEAGLVKDITAETDEFAGSLSGATSLYEVGGARYGLPFNAGMVGFWYNQDLFAEAGAEVPETWEDLLATIDTLKGAGITPIAVGAGDKWPAHFWYTYLMIRLCGGDTMVEIAADGDFTRDCVVQAGEMVAELVATEPFQPGFLGAGWDAPDGESGWKGSVAAAMDLMGQWAPGAFRAQAGGGDVPLEWNLGWFPFPSVAGGAGADTDALGGADGFAVGKDAPAEAVDFLMFLLNEENQATWAANSGLPVNPAANSAVTDENMVAVLDGLGEADFVQLYLDQFFTAEIGGQINDQTALLFGGATSPADAAAAITATAQG